MLARRRGQVVWYIGLATSLNRFVTPYGHLLSQAVVIEIPLFLVMTVTL